MGHKRKIVLVLLWAAMAVFCLFTVAAMHNARVLGDVAFMARGDAVAVFTLAIVMIPVLVISLVVTIATPSDR